MSYSSNKKEFQELVTQKYLNGQSMVSIGKELNKDKRTVKLALVKNGVKLRSVSEWNRTYKINKDYFEIIDTEEKAYFLGFLFADGCVHKNKLEISLHHEDRYILERFRKCIYVENDYSLEEINRSTCEKQFRLLVTSDKISNDLKNKGCIERKTYDLKFPELKDELTRHFVRGFFDGDGSIYSVKTNNDNVQTCAGFCCYCKDFLLQIQKILITKEIFANLNKPRIWALMVQNKNDLLKLEKYLYENSDETLMLTRKRDRFTKFREEYGNQYFDRKKSKGNYNGVRFHKNRWYAEATINKKFIYIGTFEKEEEAAIAFNEKLKECGITDPKRFNYL
jgi:hypothetical protein